MKILLRARHWQLFCVAIGIPFLLYIIMLTFAVSVVNKGVLPVNNSFLIMMRVYPFIFFLALGTQLAWMWSVTTSLQARLRPSLRMDMRYLGPALLTPALILFGSGIFMFNMISPYHGLNSAVLSPFIVPVLLVVQVVFLACTFYAYYVTSKTIKTYELQQKPAISDYTGEFVLVWFFFIGVWLLQPRINAWYEETEALV